MTTPSDAAARPVPVRVVLPADPVLGQPEQAVVARLWRWRQTGTGWVYLVGLPSYRDLEDGGVEAAGTGCGSGRLSMCGRSMASTTTRSPPSLFRRRRRSRWSARSSGEHRPSGWVLAKVREGRGPARGVLHASDCAEAPQGAPLLGVEQALDVAEHPGTQLCTLCGCAQELTPVLNGFDHITDSPGS